MSEDEREFWSQAIRGMRERLLKNTIYYLPQAQEPVQHFVVAMKRIRAILKFGEQVMAIDDAKLMQDFEETSQKSAAIWENKDEDYRDHEMGPSRQQRDAKALWAAFEARWGLICQSNIH